MVLMIFFTSVGSDGTQIFEALEGEKKFVMVSSIAVPALGEGRGAE